MIKELINFTENLDEDVFSWNKKPSNGLHIFLNMTSNSEFQDFSFFYYSSKREKVDENDQTLNEKVIKYESYGRRIGTNMNKAYHKKLFACNPFIISFKKKSYGEINIEDLRTFLNTAQNVVKLSTYESSIAMIFFKEVERLMQGEIKKLMYKSITKNNVNGKDENVFNLIGKDEYINFYLESFPMESGDINATNFKKYHDIYLNQKGFNKDDADYKIGLVSDTKEGKYKFHNQLFKKEVDNKGKETKYYSTDFNDEFKGYFLERNYGISDYLNGLNSKKPYLEHKTAMFQKGISQYIDGDMAMALYKFEQLITTNRILPNPLPIMIWQDKNDDSNSSDDVFLKEYTNNISIIKDKEIRIGFTEVLKNLFEQNHSFKLSNFYLFNYAGGKLRDFDFVNNFRYKIENLSIKLFFGETSNILFKIDVKNIFDFEREIVHKIFDNGIVTEYKIEQTLNKEKLEFRGTLFKYFDDLKESNYKAHMFLLVSKYRKAFYDYIYKSKTEVLDSVIIEEVLRVGLLDDIVSDEFNNGKNSNKSKIHKKLNIWFSLYDYFQNTKIKKDTMASKIEQFKSDLVEVIKGKRSIEDGEDELFAYISGQVVFYIQSKSRSADKSYARLEPFLNKTGAKEFKQTLKDEFAKYKHERYSSEFNNPFAQVNVYPLSQNMKDLLPFFLGGYFSENLLFPGAINE